MSIHRRNGKWQVKWAEGGRQRSLTFATWDEADALDRTLRKARELRKRERTLAKTLASLRSEACIVWTGGVTKGLYANISVAKNQSRLGHKLVYEWVHGPVPDGWEVHHTCENPACVNVEHLVALTRVEHKRAHRDLDAAKMNRVTRQLED